MTEARENIDNIVNRYLSGESATKISEDFNCSSTHIYCLLDEKDVERRDQKEAQNKIQIENLEQMYWEKGMSLYQIAEEVGCNAQTVLDRMEEEDIPRREQMDYHIKSPVAFETEKRGYERWRHHWKGDCDEIHIHRLLAVSEYGIDRVKGNVVHHKNEIKWDNRPENIEVMSNREHSSYHSNKMWGNHE